MASVRKVSSVIATAFSLCILALTHLPILLCSSAPSLYEAGNASFIAGQKGSFWSSETGDYLFGFSSINQKDNEFLLSIWHSADSNRTAIWWAGLDNSPIVISGSTLNFTINGSLQLHNPQGTLLWSSSSSASYAQLEDTGNLALLERDGVSVTWQSFEHARDSLMLSDLQANIVANKSFLLQSRSNGSSFAPGRFHVETDAYLNLYFHAMDSLHNDFIYIYASMNTTNGLQISKDNLIPFRSNSSASKLQRMTLDYDGNLRVYMWESNLSSWKAVWQLIDDKCLLGSPCGAFGICNEVDGGNDNGLNCSCPPGYQRRDAGDVSQGCVSLISFNASCGTNATTNYSKSMVEVPHSDYNYNDLERESNVGLNDCGNLCLNDCRCMAASYGNDGTCFLKGNSQVGYLLNGYASDTNTLLIKLVHANGKQGRRPWVIGVGVGVPLGVILIAALAFCAWFLIRQRAKSRGKRSREFYMEGPVRYFGYQELVEATNNFSEKLGEGGFGVVYKGWVEREQISGHSETQKPPISPSTGNNSNWQIAVAVKLLKGGMDEERKAGHDGPGMQFRAEVKTLGNIHHVNLVSLLGYCSRRRGAGEQRLLVYEYMENGSLDTFLACSERALLPWATRYSIALGAARGIAYLHHECSPPIMHCDIKPHNILLDNQFTAKVADFGFARRFHLDSHITMSGIRGTRGYLAPEWLTSQELTSKVDVFSFGILLLELVRGFKSVDDINTPLLEWAIQCIMKGAVNDLHPQIEEDEPNKVKPTFDLATSTEDQSLESKEAAQKLQVLKVGMWCIQPQPSMRPAMSRVIQLIEGTLPVEDPPAPRTSTPFVVLPHSMLSDSEYGSSTATITSSTENPYSAVSGR